MEPANLTPTPDRDDARLAALLGEPARALPDDGFSARVLAALPPPTRVPTRRSRVSWCVAAAGLGTFVALAGAAPWADLRESWSPVLSALAPVSASFSDPDVLAALVVALASVIYALRPLGGRRTA